jgi:hypothetical protein
MTANATNYGFLNSSTGALQVNTSGVPTGSVPIFRAVTNASTVMGVVDARVTYTGGGLGSGGMGPLLQTNGPNNGSQTTLNIQQGANLTATDNGSGQITVALAASPSVSGNLGVTGTSTLGGAVTDNSSLSVTGTSSFGGTVTDNSSLKPNGDDSNALGDSTHRWMASLGTSTSKSLNSIQYADQFSGSDLGTQINNAFAVASSSGTLPCQVFVSPNPAITNITTQVVVPAQCVLRFMGGAFQVNTTGGAGVNAFTIKEGGSILCDGANKTVFGLGTNNLDTVVTTFKTDGTQQYASIDGCFIDANTNGPTVNKAAILFGGVGQPSRIANVEIVAPRTAPGIELVNAGVDIEETWVYTNNNIGVGGILYTNDGVLNPNIGGGYMKDVHVEHFAHDTYGIKFLPLGGSSFRNVVLTHVHCEQNVTDSGSGFDCIRFDGSGIKSAIVTNVTDTQNAGSTNHVVTIANSASGVTVLNADCFSCHDVIHDLVRSITLTTGPVNYMQTGLYGPLTQRRGTAGCSTTGGASPWTGSCANTLTWNTPFVDTNYTVSCQGNGVGAGVPVIGIIASKTTTGVNISTQQATGVNASFSTVECIAIHD